MFAIAHFSREAHGSQGYINDLDLSEGGWQSAPTLSMAYVTAVFVPQRTISPATASNDYQSFLATLSPDWPLLSRIIVCESNWHPEAANKSSTARGIFQFLASTWSKWGHGSVLDPYDNIRAGVKLYEAQGTNPWNASKSCWGG